MTGIKLPEPFGLDIPTDEGALVGLRAVVTR
jgi:hypothetical protein